MIESFPKLADVKLLKELSKILIIPMLVASFVVQTGLTLDLRFMNFSVSQDAAISLQAIQFIFIFALKGAFISLVAVTLNSILIYAHLYSNFTALKILSICFLSFGFLGVFAGTELEFLNLLNKMWFYTSFVLGFYCLATATDIENFGI